MSDVVSFFRAPTSADDYINNAQIKIITHMKLTFSKSCFIFHANVINEKHIDTTNNCVLYFCKKKMG